MSRTSNRPVLSVFLGALCLAAIVVAITSVGAAPHGSCTPATVSAISPTIVDRQTIAARPRSCGDQYHHSVSSNSSATISRNRTRADSETGAARVSARPGTGTRVDPDPDTITEIPDFQLRVTVWDSRETRLTVKVTDGKFAGCIMEQGGACLLHPEKLVAAAYEKIIEVSLARELFDLRDRRSLLLSVALWEGGLPIDVLPIDGMLELSLGEESFAWNSE